MQIYAGLNFLPKVMGFIAVIVNCGLIGLSGPVHRIFPNITGAQTVILIIVLEHLMLLLKLVLSAAIPDVPHTVRYLDNIMMIIMMTTRLP